MNVVTFETAKRLKDAGFPQPEIVLAGQFLYSEDGELFLNEIRIKSYWFAFAPSATDILKELGYNLALKFFDDSQKFCCWQDNQDGSWQTWTNENPAEACAAAWLSIYEKTTNQ